MNEGESLSTSPLAARFVEQVRARPRAHALLVRDEHSFRPITYQQLAADIWLQLQSLERQGMRATKRVVQIGGNGYPWIVTDLALQFLQAVHLPINPARSEQQIDRILAHAHSDAIMEHAAEQWRSETQPLPDQFLNELADRARAIDPNALMTILYTSGTTGEPKGVMLTHGNFAADLSALLHVSPVRPDEVRLSLLPFSHVFGRTNDLYAALVSGCCLALSPSTETFFRDLAEVRPTFFNGVPYLFDKCMQQFLKLGQASQTSSFREFLGGRIEKVNCGGAKVSPVVEKFFWEQDVPLITGYGLTETSPVVAASSVDRHRNGCVGHAIPGVNLRIADDGELLVRGPNVMAGYFADPELTARTIRGGWLYTGDLARIDSDGFLEIIGRKTDVIVTSTGYKIQPSAIEAILLTHPQIKQCCVVGNGMPRLSLIIVQTENATRDEATMLEFCQRRLSHLASYEQIRQVIIAEVPFSFESGLLNEKGSMRRLAIEAFYRDQISG
jgi:long-chain acyl-CoA synthetase